MAGGPHRAGRMARRRSGSRWVRDHLVRGYTVNERRLVELGLDEAQETLDPPARSRAIIAMRGSGKGDRS